MSQELINELRLILEEDFGLKLSIYEVTEIARSLVGYFDLIVKINFENK